MLDEYHRAVYRVHSRQPACLVDRRIFYVVRKLPDGAYEVTYYYHRKEIGLPRAALRGLDAACHCFTSKGLDIKPVENPAKVHIRYGGWCVTQVDLAVAA